MKNLDNNVRLAKDLQQSLNELWNILKKDENLQTKWQQVGQSQSYATVLQQKRNSENRNPAEEIKNDDRNQVEQTFKLVVFGNSVTKLIVPHQMIKCIEHIAKAELSSIFRKQWHKSW